MKIKFRFNELNQLVEICKKLKDNDFPPSTYRAVKGKELFDKIFLHSLSFIKLWPKKDEPDTIKNIDAGSLVSIARNIIETHHVYHYICEPKITEEELEFRIALKSLHYSCNTLDILSKLGFSESDNVVSTLVVTKKCSIRSLEQNPFFSSLDNGRRSYLLTGQKPYCLNKEDNKLESALYNLFSNSIHSFPLGVRNNFEGHFDNHVSRINMLFLAHETVILYLSSVVKAYISLRRKLSLCISNDEKEFLKTIDDSYLRKWIESRKIIGYKESLL
jgi:hypothetical protein